MSAPFAADGRQEAQLETVAQEVDRRVDGTAEAASSSPAAPTTPRGDQARAGTGSALKESDAVYLLKLLFVSFGGARPARLLRSRLLLRVGNICSLLKCCERVAGAAAVKYGSLLLDAPFQPNLALALSIVASPVAAYSVFLLLKSREGA